MSIRVMSLAVLMALALNACQKDEDVEPVAVADTAVQSAPAAMPVDSSGLASGAVAEMQSAALEQQDTTAALTEAANAAVGMAHEAAHK